jgi:hypothetical protein
MTRSVQATETDEQTKCGHNTTWTVGRNHSSMQARTIRSK